MSRWFLAVFLCGLGLTMPAIANPAPSQVFYVPFPEDNQLAGYVGVNVAAVDPLAVFVNFSASADNTVIYYDHWEDGYETDVTNPRQSTTLVFGDGNPANGYPPGNAGDLISAGTVFSLRNYVTSTTLQSVVDFDARDKISSFKPISVTKTSFPASTNSLLAGCVEVFEKGIWGTEYRVPVGTNMPTSTASSTLAWDANIFDYAAISVMAGAGGAIVTIDGDNNAVTPDQTVTLAEGETRYVEGVSVGATVVSDKPVQVVLFTGRPTSNYQSRDTSLLPTTRWSTSYFAPVSTPSANGTVVFLYNPGKGAITVSYDFRRNTTSYTTATVSIPAGGNARVTLAASDGTSNFGAYKFYTTGATPPVFYAFCAVDAASSTIGSNQAYDGGFTLVGQPSLTTQVLVSLGIGRDPYSSTNPAENGNPVWITTAGNGHTAETVFVDFNGDNAGPETDLNGNKYDVSHNLRELEQRKIFDPDGDQSGMLIYVLNPNVKIAAAWAQDPSVAAAGQPGLDVSTLIPPLREGDASKGSSIEIDADGDGYRSPGDTLEYDIRTINTARASVNGPFTITDNLPADLNYIPGSTKYRYSVKGAWQAWVQVPDDASGTAFPLDVSGFSIPGTLGVGQQIQAVFRAAIKTYSNISVGASRITNTGSVVVTPYGITVGLEWTDLLYGSIGDRVWADLNGNGLQDPGENGLNGVVVYADGNNNGVRDAGEPVSVTSGDGAYLLGGLLAGNYIVRVDAGSIAALDPGYGPSFDIDGITTSYVANVTLAAAQRIVDVDFGFREGASLGDRVWYDFNGDGIQGVGEPGMNGVRVFIDSNGDGTYQAGEVNTITSGDGGYLIGNLGMGTYSVCIDSNTLPGGAVQTIDLDGVATSNKAEVAFLGAQHRADLDFGYRGTLSIGDLVWNDVNANGSRVIYNVINGRIDINNSGSADNSDDGTIETVQIIKGRVDLDGDGAISAADAGIFQGLSVIAGEIDVNNSTSVDGSDDATGALGSEAGIPNVRVYIDSNENGFFDANEVSSTTNPSGFYSISNLPNGTYSVRVDTATLQNSMASTYDLTNPTTDSKATVVLSGTSRTDVDFGYRNDASIGDRIWNDMDNDGIQDMGEPGIEGVLVYIDVDGDNIFDQGVERFSISNVNGVYSFGNLAVGTYSVRVEISTLPRGSSQTYDLDGLGTTHEANRSVTLSEDATDVDFGYRTSSSVGDFVWIDSDADGVQDSGELGISGARVYLDINGNGIFDTASEPSSVTTGAGAYSISGLVSGTYTARVDLSTLPAGLVITYDLGGGLDNAASFMLNPSQARTDVDFGYTRPVSIGERVWNDLNANGVLDSGEPGIDGVSVTLYNAVSTTIAGTSITAGGGNYLFGNLLPGTYFVEFAAVSGYSWTLVDVGIDTTDSDAASLTGRTPSVALTSGQSNTTLDAGYIRLGSISGTVLDDIDDDKDGDNPLEGVLIELLDQFGFPVLDSSGVPIAAVTLADGTYSIGNLLPGQYCVRQIQPSNYGSVSDSDGLNDNIIGNLNPITLGAGSNIGGNDFVEIKLGEISGYVRMDTDNNGSGDAAVSGVFLSLLNGTGAPVLDSSGDPVRVVTNINGFYRLSLVGTGTYRVSQSQPPGYGSISDVDGANNNIVGDETPIVMTPGLVVANRDFVEVAFGSISGRVFKDTDADGIGDTLLAGVLIALLDAVGNPVDGDLLTPGVQARTFTTGVDGSYFFGSLFPGSYQISETQPSGYASVSDVDAGNLNLIGNIIPLRVDAGQQVIERDFVEIELGTISGFVHAGPNPLSGVSLTLLDRFGNPIDGDSVTPGVQSITTVTDALGFYRFNGVFRGSYQVSQTQPYGYNSVADVDGGDVNIIGDKAPIVIAPGQVHEMNNFLEAIDTCPDDWAQWKFQHPGESASGNPDSDSYDNFAEFAFAMPIENGLGSQWLQNTAWIIQPSEIAPGTLDGVFVRPKGAPLNVTYTLQFAASVGNPTSWNSMVITPLMISVKDNQDCTETVTIHDLEGLTTLTSGTGNVRIKAELDESPGSGTDHISYSEVEGWKETPLELCCRTYNNPFLRESVFTGRVGSVVGQSISFGMSAGTIDLSPLLPMSGKFYLEVASGDNEGHRFDVMSASGSTVTLADDKNLFAASPPYNTLKDALPLTLVSDQVVIRRHWTLGEMFPVSGFGASGSQSSADQVQVFVDGVWAIYWLYDLNDGDSTSARWVAATDSGMVDQGGIVIPPGQGLFFFKRNSVTSILAYGELRANDFIRPLSSGSNLVAGGYPLDQSANGFRGRAMNLSQGFFGSFDFKSADSIYVWKSDTEIGVAGYDTYYLLHGAPARPTLLRWVKVGDATALIRDSEVFIQGNRSVFVRAKGILESYKIPKAWSP